MSCAEVPEPDLSPPAPPKPLPRDDVIELVEVEMATLCGVINAAEARLVELVEQAIEQEMWAQHGVMSLEHWISWQCGLSPARARQLAAAARRRAELPVTMARFAEGLLSADQVNAIVRHVPAVKDAEVAEFAQVATVSQLRRTVSRYSWGDDKPEPTREEKRECGFGSTDENTWQMHVSAPIDEGAKIEEALKAKRKELINAATDVESRRAVTWLDALLALVDQAVENDDAKVLGRRKRYLVNLHMNFDEHGEWTGHLHMGPLLSKALLRLQSCDAAVRPIMEQLGLPVSVGRTVYTVADRTRLVVEHRDRGCRVPGCSAHRVEVHHIVHWTDGGSTDTWNLVCLCPRHHRLHHLGALGITGNADDPDGLIFTNEWGRPIPTAGSPSPPGAPPGEAATKAGLPWQPYIHGLGERLDSRNVWFGPAQSGAA